MIGIHPEAEKQAEGQSQGHGTKAYGLFCSALGMSVSLLATPDSFESTRPNLY